MQEYYWNTFWLWAVVPVLGKKQAALNPIIGTNAAGIQVLHSGHWKYIDGQFPHAAPENLRKAFRKEAEPALYESGKGSR